MSKIIVTTEKARRILIENRPEAKTLFIKEDFANKLMIIHAALDSIEDSEEAILEFQQVKGIPGYLQLFGYLEAIFIQQNAFSDQRADLIVSRHNDSVTIIFRMGSEKFRCSDWGFDNALKKALEVARNKVRNMQLTE